MSNKETLRFDWWKILLNCNGSTQSILLTDVNLSFVGVKVTIREIGSLSDTGVEADKTCGRNFLFSFTEFGVRFSRNAARLNNLLLLLLCIICGRYYVE